MKVISIPRKGDMFTLYPLSDVHWPAHDQEKLDQWREAVLEDETSLVTLGGDLCDFARGKYRAHIGSYTLDDNSRTAIDDFAYSKVDGIAEFLKPVAHKIIGVCVGNHFWRFANGRVSDQEIALQLGVGNRFVGALGLFRVDLKNGPVRIALHHDAGRRGGTASADMLAFQHWSHAVASDIYVAGHTHRQYAGIFQTRVMIDGEQDKVSDQKLVFIRSGAFMRGYEESVLNPENPYTPDYAEVMMLPPSVLGIISVDAKVTSRGKIQYTLQQRTL
jgi:predicted phosphodiesterase